MTAAEARQLAAAATAPMELEEVQKKISEHAEKGFCSAWMERRLLPAVVQQLEEDGFQVYPRAVCAGGGDVRYSTEISWL